MEWSQAMLSLHSNIFCWRDKSSYYLDGEMGRCQHGYLKWGKVKSGGSRPVSMWLPGGTSLKSVLPVYNLSSPGPTELRPVCSPLFLSFTSCYLSPPFQDSGLRPSWCVFTGAVSLPGGFSWCSSPLFLATALQVAYPEAGPPWTGWVSGGPGLRCSGGEGGEREEKSINRDLWIPDFGYLCVQSFERPSCFCF